MAERNEKGHFVKGNSGRPKGSKNKYTDLRKSFLNAYEEWGGDERLLEWIKESKQNERLFVQYLTKMLPTNVTAEHSGKIETGGEFVFRVVDHEKEEGDGTT